MLNYALGKEEGNPERLNLAIIGALGRFFALSGNIGICNLITQEKPTMLWVERGRRRLCNLVVHTVQ